MSAPPHIASFRKFVDRAPDDHLRVFVAFGLFMQSEQYWINERNNDPDTRACSRYHDYFLNDYHIQQLLDDATEQLNKFSDSIAGDNRDEFFQFILSAQERFSWKSVFESVVAAAIYSALLIFFSIVALRNGIDVVETYKNWAGLHQEQQHASPGTPAPATAQIPASGAPVVGIGNKIDSIANPSGHLSK